MDLREMERLQINPAARLAEARRQAAAKPAAGKPTVAPPTREEILAEAPDYDKCTALRRLQIVRRVEAEKAKRLAAEHEANEKAAKEMQAAVETELKRRAVEASADAAERQAAQEQGSTI
jgi:hypothetical protein